MTPQSAAFLEKAQALLDEAETTLKVDLADAARASGLVPLGIPTRAR